MDRPSTPAAVALIALLAVGALAVMQGVPAIQTAELQDLSVHVVLIGLATLVMAALGALSLRTFYKSGAVRSLALGAGLLAFAAIYTWHGVYTTTSPAFAFLIYGPLSRAAFGLALPLLIVAAVVPRHRRFLTITGVVAGGALLAAASWSLHPVLSQWASGATVAQIQSVRLSVEAVAGALAALTVGLLLLDGRHKPSGANLVITLSVTLLAFESAYFMFTNAWTPTWWAAHAIGAVSSLALTIAVVTELGAAENAEELGKLRQLNDMRTRFINAAAHELGTPLTPIQLQLSLMRNRKDPLTEAQVKSMETIQRNVDRLADLTRSILEGARSQEGHFPIRLEPADLRETIDDLERSYSPWCSEKDITLSVDAPATLNTFSDRRRIHQIVSNFVSNAIKNTPEGGHIHITASARRRRLRIEVRDDGRGMTDHERHRLFQPFTQLDDPSKVIGSGLGLYITRQLAERLGGFVGVRSKGLGKGSTFFVDLPLEAPGNAESRAEAAKEAESAERAEISVAAPQG